MVVLGDDVLMRVLQIWSKRFSRTEVEIDKEGVMVVCMASWESWSSTGTENEPPERDFESFGSDGVVDSSKIGRL